jgi:hypothetical protein
VKTLKRNECAVLPLVLKTKWYRMIESGEKREEYRDKTPYWDKRIVNWINRHVDEDKPAVVEFRLGYQANAQRMAFLLDALFGPAPRTSVVPAFTSHPEWGEPIGAYWTIRLGERVEFDDETNRVLDTPSTPLQLRSVLSTIAQIADFERTVPTITPFCPTVAARLDVTRCRMAECGKLAKMGLGFYLRNCDLYATVGAAHKAWRATSLERDFCDWLFEKAEGTEVSP